MDSPLVKVTHHSDLPIRFGRRLTYSTFMMCCGVTCLVALSVKGEPLMVSYIKAQCILSSEHLLCEQRRTDHRRTPKNNYIFEQSWNLV